MSITGRITGSSRKTLPLWLLPSHFKRFGHYLQAIPRPNTLKVGCSVSRVLNHGHEKPSPRRAGRRC